jgi:superfamily I DNA/RNA helicase
LEPLDQILKGGLSKGRWIMFGDFERQSIYGDANDWRAFARDNNASVRTLRINCRNTKLIAKYAEILGGMQPGYSAVRRLGDGARPDLRFYGNEEEQRLLLVDVLETLRKRFEWRDIVVLSAKRDEISCILQLPDTPWKARLAPFSFNASGLRYSTIHRFKGLEKCAVVVTDIDSMGAEERSSLLYVATTRAVD